MIPKREKDTDIGSDIARGKMLKKKVAKLAEEAAGRFIESSTGETLNTIIASIAKREGFNQLQIQRLVEEANTVAYNKKYNEVKKNNDRRISFELAELESIVAEMGADAPESIDNPNWVSGRPGEGEIQKEASIESHPVHRPNSRVDTARAKMMEKKAAQERKEDQKAIDRLQKETDSYLFKVAQSLVRTEQIHKNANEVFNTMLGDVEWSDKTVEALTKKASDLSEHLARNGRISPRSVVSLKEEPQEKVANSLLGAHSLVHNGNQENPKVKNPEVAPTASASDYDQLIEMAKRIKESQKQTEQLQHKHKTKENEVDKNG